MSAVHTAPPNPTRPLAQNGILFLLGNSLLVSLWLWLYWPVFSYLSLIFSREDFRTNQILLLGVLLLIGIQVRQGGLPLPLDRGPQLALIPLTFVLGGSLLFVLVEHTVAINTVSASLFILASYGLVGLWMDSARWRQGLPAMFLLIGVLPIGHHMQTFIGYPMRILTAGIVRDGLQAVGITTVGVDTILMFENGVAQVDLPCSGVKSLWTGALFLTAVTWLDRRPLNLRWLLVGGLFAVILFLANLARVGVLIVVGEVAGWRLLAEMLHVPLGVLGFTIACTLGLVLLRWIGGAAAGADTISIASYGSRPRWLAPLIAICLVGLALAYTPRTAEGLTQPPLPWQFPAELQIEPMPLRPDEQILLTRDGADSAERLRFTWRGISGSMILIPSTTWRAHHRPERCYEVYGLSIDKSRGHLVHAGLPMRAVSLGQGDTRAAFSAAYWFQSATQTTDDYTRRIWADFTTARERWVLVSILFDEQTEPYDTDVAELYTALHEAVAQTLAVSQ